MAKHPFPEKDDIIREYWQHLVHEYITFDDQRADCYVTITSMNAWDRLAANDPDISCEIHANLESSRSDRYPHSGPSWDGLINQFVNLARTGFPDRFLLKNKHFWVMGYYTPDYFPEVLFVAGGSVIAALSW